jgi:RNA polymerase sigma factor (sigma-70 family)
MADVDRTLDVQEEARVYDKTDAELLTAAAVGDEDAFAAFFRRHASAVTGFAVRRAKDPDEVADIVSETFLIALQAAGRYRPETPTAAPWLFGIARRVWIGRYRTHSRIRRLKVKLDGSSVRYDGSEADAVEAAIDSARQRPILEEALGLLPDSEREVLELVAIHGLAPMEAAVAMGITANAARLRLSRARKRMREHLASEPSWAPVLGLVEADFA